MLLAASPFESRKELHEIAAEIVAEIAAFLHENSWKPQARDPGSHGAKAAARHLESLQRVALAGIEAERHDQHRRAELANARQRLVAGVEPGCVRRAKWQRQVEIEAVALAGAGLVRVAPEVRIVDARIGVDRDG